MLVMEEVVAVMVTDTVMDTEAVTVEMESLKLFLLSPEDMAQEVTVVVMEDMDQVLKETLLKQSL